MRNFRTLTHVYMEHGGLVGNGLWTDEKGADFDEIVMYRKALMAQLVMNDPTRVHGTINTYHTYVGQVYRILMGEWPCIKYSVEYQSTDMGRVVFTAWTVRDDAPPHITASLN
jgi:hypothetical protein